MRTKITDLSNIKRNRIDL